jgi:hypothetical protein
MSEFGFWFLILLLGYSFIVTLIQSRNAGKFRVDKYGVPEKYAAPYVFVVDACLLGVSLLVLLGVI